MVPALEVPCLLDDFKVSVVELVTESVAESAVASVTDRLVFNAFVVDTLAFFQIAVGFFVEFVT